ncbi:MAG: hypothetical protein IT447_04735 [Phycisphaerales bacterium]|jgi:hypothetical protein|nr:hypothetical protein [Phycisphaerales bacterium]
MRYVGEVVYIYAFDVAYELIQRPLRELLGQPVAQFVVDASKRSPRQLFFYRPNMVRLPPLERIGPRGPLRLQRTIKLLPVGAISITVRVPFEVDKLEDLVPYHDLQFNDGTYLYDEVRQLAEDARRELQPQFIRPMPQLSDEEAYTVFCVHSPMRDAAGEPISAEQWLGDHRQSVAALLTEETRPRQLSDQEADESTSKYYSYYEQDLVVVDWDAALIIDEPRYFDEVLHIMELANLQLAELEAYDRILDNAVDRSYRDIGGGGGRLRGRQNNRVQRELQEIRIDFARLSDELSNITKFFGDWHLARIYQGLSQRFHLSDWHRTIDEKLKTLDDLYQILRHDQTNRWMLLLEVMIVLLFIIDVVLLLFGGK